MAKVIVPQGDEAKLFRDILRNRSGYRFIEMLDEQAKKMTGFESWAAAGPFWDLPAADEFRILVGGQGRIQGEIVTWAGSQSITLTANRTHYVYMDSTGTIGHATDATITDTTYESNVVLFEVLYDGTNVIVVKENHPYKFQTDISRYLHNNVGTVIRSIGAIPTRVSVGTGAAAGDREIQIVGADVLEDHGLETTIPDSAGAGVTWNFYYKNAGGQWLRNASQTQTPMLYNNAGTPTAITSGSYGIMRIGISKDSLNSSTPVYFAVFHNAQYANLVLAQNAIAAGGIVNWDNELAAIEIAQLGYIIVQNNGSGGYINQIDVQKSSFSTRFVGGAGTGNHGLLTELTDDDHPQYALLAGRSGDTYVTEIIQALTSAGLQIKNMGGTTVLSLGAGGGTGITTADGFVVTGTLMGDVIAERTADAGVTIDGNLLKDGGISFDGTNFLEDYEPNGTFTPSVQASGTAGTPTQRGTNDGRYTLIGERVFFEMVVGISAWADSPTGGIQIAGLPFVNGSGILPIFPVLPTTALTFATDTSILGQGQNGTAVIDLVSFSTGTNAIVVAVTDTNFNIRISGCYQR